MNREDRLNLVIRAQGGGSSLICRLSDIQYAYGLGAKGTTIVNLKSAPNPFEVGIPFEEFVDALKKATQKPT